MSTVMKNILCKASVVVVPVILFMGTMAGLSGSSDYTASASGYSGDPSAYTNLGDYIVKTDESGAMPKLTKEQLEKSIDQCFSGQAQKNYKDTVDAFVSIQDKYNVNAAFAIANAQIESTGGTNWGYIDSSTYNWFSFTGNAGGGYVDNNGTSWDRYTSFSEATEYYGKYIKELYFSENRYNVYDIMDKYNHDNASNEASIIEGIIDKIYAVVSVDINVGEGGVYENDTYTYNGKKYTLFKQHDYQDSYAGGTIDTSGCGVTSVSIIVSAYKSGETPPSIAKNCEPKYGNTVEPRLGYADPGGVFHKFLGEYGLTCKEYDGFDSNAIINHLKSGKQVIFNYGGKLKMNSADGYYTDGHFTTFLGMDTNGDIFVGDPAGCSGYTTMQNIKNVGNKKRYFLVSEK